MEHRTAREIRRKGLVVFSVGRVDGFLEIVAGVVTWLAECADLEVGTLVGFFWKRVPSVASDEEKQEKKS